MQKAEDENLCKREGVRPVPTNKYSDVFWGGSDVSMDKNKS